jgi:aryl-alcohol dehydrogenase-like predicted oxidoreductase
MKPGSSRRDFIRRALFGGAIGGLLARTASVSAQTEPHLVDRRKLGRIGSDISILGLGLGGEFIRGYDRSLETGHSLLESALAKGINYWDTARSYGPSEAMIAPVLTRNREKVFLASKSDSRDYDGFKRDLERSLQVLRTNYIDLYHLHDMQPDELANLGKIESGAVRAARQAKEQKMIRAFGFTGHSGATILVECMKRFDPDAVLTIFPATRPDKGRYEDELLPLARSKKIGVVAMKTIRYGHQANLSAKELLRYALSLDGVHSAIVGLDTLEHLNENAALVSGFKSMKAAGRLQIHQHASRALAGLLPPWERPGYIDG